MALRLELISAAPAGVVGVVVGAMCAFLAFVLVPASVVAAAISVVVLVVAR